MVQSSNLLNQGRWQDEFVQIGGAIETKVVMFVSPEHGEIVTEKHAHPFLQAQHIGKIYLRFDSLEWDAWCSYISR